MAYAIGDNNTITFRELTEHFSRMYPWAGSDAGFKWAEKVFAEIIAKREPPLIEGALYQDANGRMLLRLDGKAYYWRWILPDGRDQYRADSFARRPLRRYVPDPEKFVKGGPVSAAEIEEETNIVRGDN